MEGVAEVNVEERKSSGTRPRAQIKGKPEVVVLAKKFKVGVTPFHSAALQGWGQEVFGFGVAPEALVCRLCGLNGYYRTTSTATSTRCSR